MELGDSVPFRLFSHLKEFLSLLTLSLKKLSANPKKTYKLIKKVRTTHTKMQKEDLDFKFLIKDVADPFDPTYWGGC